MEIINPKLRLLLLEKDEFVKKGRSVSNDIEKLDKKIEDAKTRQREYTNNCNPEDLIAKGNAIEKQVNDLLKVLETIGNEVQATKIAAIPAKEIKQYETLKAEREEKERERNKLALKVQKIKDKAIPMIQKAVQPSLGEYEDMESAQIKGEKIIVTTFSHLEEWKKAFKKKQTDIK